MRATSCWFHTVARANVKNINNGQCPRLICPGIARTRRVQRPCACAINDGKIAERLRRWKACSRRVQWCASGLASRSGRMQTTKMTMTMHRNPLQRAGRFLHAALVVGALLPLLCLLFWAAGDVARAADDVTRWDG